MIVGHTISEISEMLSIEESSVYNRIWRAKKQLKKELVDIIRKKLTPLKFEEVCKNLLNIRKYELLKYPILLFEMSSNCFYNVSVYTINKTDKLSNFLIMFNHAKCLPYITIFTEEPDTFKIYLNSIPSHLLASSIGFICYKEWMIDILKEYMDKEIKFRKYFNYGFPDKNLSKLQGEDNCGIRILNKDDVQLAREFEEKYREPEPLPEGFPARLDSVLKDDLEINRGKIFAKVKDSQLISFAYLRYSNIPGSNKKAWNLEELWTLKKYRRQGIAEEIVKKAIKWVYKREERLYCYVLKKMEPVEDYVESMNVTAVRKLLEKVGFVLCNKKYYRVFD